MADDIGISIGIEGDVSQGKVIKRTLDDIADSNEKLIKSFTKSEAIKIREDNANKRLAASQLRANQAMERTVVGAKRLEIQKRRLELQEKRLDEQTKRLNDRTRKSKSAFDILHKSIFTIKNLIATTLVVGINSSVDAFIKLETQIQNVTNSSIEFNKVMSNLYEIAQENGSSFTALGDAYNKLNVSLPEAVRNTTDLVKVTELLSRGVIC